MADDQTLMTTESMALVLDDNGCCVRHPHIRLKEKDENGDVYLKESCPECQEEFEKTQDVLREKRRLLDEKLQELGQDSPHDERHADFVRMVRPEVPVQPPVVTADMDGMAAQMQHIQYMQDILLFQKDKEVQELRQKVEDQQEELTKKSVEIALLTERMSQQAQNYERELKLLKRANKERKYPTGSPPSPRKVKEIRIGELHVHGQAPPGECNETVEQTAKKTLQEKLQQDQITDKVIVEDTACTEDEVAVPPAKDKPQQEEAAAPSNLKEAPKAAPPTKPTPSEPKAAPPSKPPPPPPTKDESKPPPADFAADAAVAAVMGGAVVGAAAMATAPKEGGNVVGTKVAATEDQVEVEPRIGRFQSDGELPAVLGKAPTSEAEFDLKEIQEEPKQQEPPSADIQFIPTSELVDDIQFIPTQDNQFQDAKPEPPKINFGKDVEEEEEEEEGGDTFDDLHMHAPPVKTRPVKRKNTPTPHHRGKDPMRASAESLPAPGGITGVSGFKPRDISPVGDELEINPNAPPTVPLNEQVTLETFDFTKPSDRFTPRVVEDDEVEEDTIGPTVATSTYGEDRHVVKNHHILDPYGDKGIYSGVVLLSTNLPHGHGKMVYEDDGRTYEGDWRHGRWHGWGKATFSNGDLYEGFYRYDQRHGQGRYTWRDGRIYEGEFTEDKRHGAGRFIWPDGALFTGDFVDGQRQGHGVYDFSDGGQYVGAWVDGRYEGYGECHWQDGRVYKGEWKNGMAHGKGTETYPDGKVRHSGQWFEDEPVRDE